MYLGFFLHFIFCMYIHNYFFQRFGPYFVEPVIAGLDPKTFEPFIASMDLIGCPMVTDDFVVSGTCSEQMYGMCESVWEPNMVCPVTRSIMVILYNCVDILRTYYTRHT